MTVFYFNNSILQINSLWDLQRVGSCVCSLQRRTGHEQIQLHITSSTETLHNHWADGTLRWARGCQTYTGNTYIASTLFHSIMRHISNNLNEFIKILMPWIIILINNQEHEPDPGMRSMNQMSFDGFARFVLDERNYAFIPENTQMDEAHMKFPLNYYFIRLTNIASVRPST